MTSNSRKQYVDCMLVCSRWACVINQDKALKREQAQAVDGVLRNKQTLATSQLIEYEKKNAPFTIVYIRLQILKISILVSLIALNVIFN